MRTTIKYLFIMLFIVACEKPEIHYTSLQGAWKFTSTYGVSAHFSIYQDKQLMLDEFGAFSINGRVYSIGGKHSVDVNPIRFILYDQAGSSGIIFQGGVTEPTYTHMTFSEYQTFENYTFAKPVKEDIVMTRE